MLLSALSFACLLVAHVANGDSMCPTEGTTPERVTEKSNYVVDFFSGQLLFTYAINRCTATSILGSYFKYACVKSSDGSWSVTKTKYNDAACSKGETLANTFTQGSVQGNVGYFECSGSDNYVEVKVSINSDCSGSLIVAAGLGGCTHNTPLLTEFYCDSTQALVQLYVDPATLSTTSTAAATTTTTEAATTTTTAAATTTEAAVISTTTGAAVVSTTTGAAVVSTTTGAAVVSTTTGAAVVSTTPGAVVSTTPGAVVSTTPGAVVSTTDSSVVSSTTGSAVVSTTDSSVASSTTGSAVVSTTGSSVASTTDAAESTSTSTSTTTSTTISTTSSAGTTAAPSPAVCKDSLYCAKWTFVSECGFVAEILKNPIYGKFESCYIADTTATTANSAASSLFVITNLVFALAVTLFSLF